ncbi:protoporphyrinogen oxidase [Thiorhodovibrio winogradskyi]|uniref:Protoporphyrinogen oxidase n=1 Tax=Thiorhodovibrio winogradskyi TaxID=77007 RepID=A0ABZ0SDU3_9GAMM|nr:NAD(P)/FAD-dependent oxidoreductase [Thiorhodovibrio winogradskyi]
MSNTGSQQIAIIIGGGPAGLTAAYELASRSNIKPVLFEAGECLGGISRTVVYKGNRIDIGGHRFFSKSQRVLDWWLGILPIQGVSSLEKLNQADRSQVSHGALQIDPVGPDPETTDLVMLVRSRLSRILFRGHLFDYPLRPSFKALRQFGFTTAVTILFGYIEKKIFPIMPERTLEDFLVNRFGWPLYESFFRDYTEKVWGVSCRQISPDWGAQRIKGVSIFNLLSHAVRSLMPKSKTQPGREIETSLIERFLYPKLGPGQLWERVAELVEKMGGEIHLRTSVAELHQIPSGKISSITVIGPTGTRRIMTGDWFISTLPVKQLIEQIHPPPPEQIKTIANGLLYRDFITVGLLLRPVKASTNRLVNTEGEWIRDNWIYIQEPEVKVGRIQIFNNWSPYLVADRNHLWLGLEYFANEDDRIWRLPDDEMAKLAISELSTLGMADENDLLDYTVIRVPKAYPAYFGTFDNFSEIRDYLDPIENLFLIGRNGMHRYNNQDHSMLAAMTAVDNILAGIKEKSNIWSVNTEQRYHESVRPQ